MKSNKIMEGPRDGEVRCLQCFARFRPELSADRAKCPKCGVEWRISWPYPKTAKIWDRCGKPIQPGWIKKSDGNLLLRFIEIENRKERSWL